MLDVLHPDLAHDIDDHAVDGSDELEHEQWRAVTLLVQVWKEVAVKAIFWGDRNVTKVLDICIILK